MRSVCDLNLQQYWPNIVSFALILLIGFPLTKFFNKALSKFLKKSKIDKTVVSFVSSLIKVISVFIVSVLAVSKLLGTDLSSLIATFGALFVAFSIILKDYISNAMSGTVILANKPFTIGDIVELGNITGEVRKVNLLSTKILTPDGKEVTVPNFKLVNDNISSFHKESRLSFSLSYTLKDNDQFRAFTESLHACSDGTFEVKVEVCRISANGIDFKVVSNCNYEEYLAFSKKIQECFESVLGVKGKLKVSEQ